MQTGVHSRMPQSHQDVQVESLAICRSNFSFPCLTPLPPCLPISSKISQEIYDCMQPVSNKGGGGVCHLTSSRQLDPWLQMALLLRRHSELIAVGRRMCIRTATSLRQPYKLLPWLPLQPPTASDWNLLFCPTGDPTPVFVMLRML
jgi:hypothetical protein